ncbi:MAG: hypothetical protein H0T19_08795 [Thermoleophilaceae bacterium]|nr:hypothetical protein [Thermoleophilaceae bacterium]
MASANGARLLAFYELIHAGDRAMLELPVVGLTDVLDGDPRRALVLNPETGQVHPFGEDIPWGGGTVLTAGYVRPAPTPFEAAPGWLAELWVVGSNEAYVGTFPVLAWEPRDRDDSEHAHGGDAVVLITDECVGGEPGPVSTRHLPGHVRYRRADEPPFGPPTPGAADFLP